MEHWLNVWLVPVILFLGCGPKRNIEPLPAWMTEDGAKNVRIDITNSLLESHNTDQALRMIALLYEEGIDTPDVKLLQGRALLQAGLTNEAEKVLLEAQRKMPRGPRPYRQLGILYADTGQLDLAITNLQSAVKINYSHPDTWNNLGYLLMARERCDEARNALEKAVSLDGADPLFRNNLAFSCVCAGDDDNALRLLRSTNSEAEARYNLGVGLETLGKTVGAKQQYQLALEADSSHAMARQAMTRLVNEDGQ